MRKRIFALPVCVCLGIGGLPFRVTASETETSTNESKDDLQI